MYLRTPKRYQSKKRRIHLFSLKWLWLWILTPVVVVAGYLIYENRAQIAPPMIDFIENSVDSVSGGVATLTAPTPAPTADPSDRIRQGDNAWAQGAIGEAVTAYEQAAQNAPNDVHVHVNYVYGLLIERQTDKAVAASERAVNANPFSADAWAVQAWALSRDEQYAAAIASGLQALSLDSEHAMALAFMAEAYLDAGQPGLARERANQALNADPNSPEALFASGLINAYSAFDDATAISDYEAARAAAPHLPHIPIELAWSEWRLGNVETAYGLIEEVLETNPNNLDALYLIGSISSQSYGEYQEAQDYFTRCTQIDPQNISCLDQLATMQVILGETQAAAQNYQRVIDAGGDAPVNYLRAGRTYVSLGECRLAIPLLREGYAMEQALAEPNIDRLTAFEEFLLECNAPFNPQFAEIPPTEAPLLVPLEESGG